MTSRSRLRSTLYSTLLFAGVSTLLGSSCKFKEVATDCVSDANCASLGSGYSCHQRFCVRSDGDVSGTGGPSLPQGGTSAAGGRPGNGGSGGRAGASGTGTAGNAGTGQSGSGASECDIPGVLAECDIPPEEYALNEGCKKGQRRCEGNTWGQCSARKNKETCNNRDDDCDERVDEDADVACYPANTDGCLETPEGSKTFDCKGRCAAGKQLCTQGVLATSCTSAKLPQPEVCSDAVAVDDDCDGMADDGCDCKVTDPARTCYAGAETDIFTGSLCIRGTQMCELQAGSPRWGTCNNQVLPVAESCANLGRDDNCNGKLDDIPNLDLPCTDTAKRGVCMTGTWKCQGTVLTCVTPSPAAAETCNGKDDDCDGMTDEPQLNPALCSGMTTCSNGICVAVPPDTDAGM